MTTSCIDWPKLASSFYNQATSHIAIAAPLYLASVLDKATVDYFLLLQLMAALLRENINPLVDLLVKNRVVGGLAQAAASNMHNTHKEKLTQNTQREMDAKTFSCWFFLLPPHTFQPIQNVDKIELKGK